MLLIAAGFVAIAVFMLRDPAENHVIAYFSMFFFGAGIPLFAWRLVRPDVLTVSPNGMTWRSSFKIVHWAWNDIQDFRAYKPSSKMISEYLGFDFTESYHQRHHGIYRVAKAIAGVEGSIGGGWELEAADLAELLNKARARWTSAA